MEINKTNKQYSTNPPPHTTLDVRDKYDKEFINLIIEIDKLYTKLIKQQKLRIESWIKKLCIPTTNKEWKKNRNLHAISLFDMLLNNKYEEPYNKFAEDSFNFPVLSKILVKSTLSDKFKQFSFNDYIVDKNIDCFSNAYLKQFMQDESILKRNLKNNKMILKESKSYQ